MCGQPCFAKLPCPRPAPHARGNTAASLAQKKIQRQKRVAIRKSGKKIGITYHVMRTRLYATEPIGEHARACTYADHKKTAQNKPRAPEIAPNITSATPAVFSGRALAW